MSKPRSYSSPARQKQAMETRQRILRAAADLFGSMGFDGTTIDAIAQEAGVAASTIYAGYRSKKGIVQALLDDARFGDAYQALVAEARGVGDARERLGVSARIARQIYESEVGVFELLRGAAAVSPDLAQMIDVQEAGRRTPQSTLIDDLQAQGQLRAGLTRQQAADLMWTLSSRDLFRMLVKDCRWSPDEYEAWLAQSLRRELCRDQ